MFDKTHSLEARNKISLTHGGNTKTKTEEHKAKLSEAKKGIIKTEGCKAKISNSIKEQNHR